jgi:hypothetical protein
MLVIAGLGVAGSAAAVEFLTNLKYLNDFAQRQPRGWERRNMELVIQTKVVDQDWRAPRVVGFHTW